MKYTHEDLKQIGLSCLNLSLRRTSRLITSYYDLKLKPIGLRITQFTLLASIAYENDPSISDLARLTDIDRTTLQRSLEILNRDGLITVEKKEIGNVRSIALTKKGELKLTKAIELWREIQKSIMEDLGKSEFKQTLQILSELRNLPGIQIGIEKE
ncbi:MarR family winged helix-turn-helix transcriptional regulator [Leptospira sp. 2 VSF19]|uniref:MarR family winged helix-turn-helix transcriptional regulator n=1 Tax=Leptospira soteropolitanensis TaxID=2950025 RepID=A0AAW5VEE5_9LEPT|nr:MarR family winged helix-turn-helix transcriptional regulator [Leptospira soteropolitanensis]MCW7493554.1 MarR family winged helix-turn-helix transcriptional regulator [Leptospira soteropolitanensis]MCW7500915.1 MarR family winged helix-turn-helix transcriptional regulator [Leptospira soteropolitanensis]MCW7523405.1 MarR family winged helix-turn-helix transcriptional regulator [Leptospira soteropolitanensis]MCW7527266.1 MarR family winged helix-turn-helix transcriptional regulator [Leptospir